MKRILYFLLTALLLAGCQAPAEPGYLFEYRGSTIAMDQEAGPVLYRLGAPSECTLAPGTDFDGLATTYSHDGFCITTYPSGSAEHISGLTFSDSGPATAEGIRIGSTLAQVEQAYGAENCTDTLCVTEKGRTRLTLTLEEGVVTAVEYSLIFR